MKTGDRVKINQSSEYYGSTPSNPKEMNGTITQNEVVSNRGHNFAVSWMNGESNFYREEDLILVEGEIVKLESKLTALCDLREGDVIFTERNDFGPISRSGLYIYFGRAKTIINSHGESSDWFYVTRATDNSNTFRDSSYCYRLDGDERIYSTGVNINDVLTGLLDKGVISQEIKDDKD